ncbi:MAG: 30S ribosomal protein S17 [Alphaproteobacteria bacterium MarineAlpha9_Bin2]|nr:MAG: 30S ribosomal protein S17 [Alphaproteobacteria bacterium MarineAlpha9_Bin2]
MPKRILQGTVITASSEKTIVVKVERRVRHPLYKKTIKRSNNFHAHDEGNDCKVGDQVRIIECKPISKKKSWSVMQEKSNKRENR